MKSIYYTSSLLIIALFMSISMIQAQDMAEAPVQSEEAQSIVFFEGSLEEAFEEAKAQNKLVFVDAYTTWCRPCKYMEKEVFTQPELGDYHNENFINIKLDLDKGEGVEFGDQYRIRAVPTLMYFNPEGKLVYRRAGAQEAHTLQKMGAKVLKKNKMKKNKK